jgi:hypothetical protein
MRRLTSSPLSSSPLPQSPWTFGRRDATDAFSLVQCEGNLRDNEAVPCAWPTDGDDARAAAAADRRREMGGGRSDCRNAWAAAAAFLAQQNRGCRSGGRQPMGPYSKFSP